MLSLSAVDGRWTDWSEWQNCTSNCGTGERKRYRSCSNPAPQCSGMVCQGPDEESMPCELVSCKCVRRICAPYMVRS